MSRKQGLERVAELLSAPIEAVDVTAVKPERGITMVAIDRLSPSPYQPRTEFAEEALAELAESIKRLGLLQPILVRPKGTGRYEIIAGERRWRAAQMAGLEQVPCIVRRVSDGEAQILALVENVHREDLSEYERGRALRQIHDTLRLSWDEIAERMGLSRRTVMRLARFAQIAPEVEGILADVPTTVRHYEALAKLAEKPQAQIELAKAIKQQGLTGPQAFKVASLVASGKKRSVKTALEEIEEKKPTKSKSEAGEAVRELMQAVVRVQGLAFAGLGKREKQALLEAVREIKKIFEEIEARLSEG